MRSTKSQKFRLYIYMYILAYNTCKHRDAFKIKHNFFYKNINNLSNYFLKIACYSYICINTYV